MFSKTKWFMGSKYVEHTNLMFLSTYSYLDK